MAVALEQMGLQRHPVGLANEIFARSPDQELLAQSRQPLLRVPGGDGPTAGAKAAAEAANIAASLGGLPDLGLPSVGAYQTGYMTAPTIVNGVGQVGNLQQGYSVMMNNTALESRVPDVRVSDVNSAPPPLPRLSGGPNSTAAMREIFSSDSRFDRPVEATMRDAELALAAATAMANAERGASQSAGSSWVAPPPPGDTYQVENRLPMNTGSTIPPYRTMEPGMVPTMMPQSLMPQTAPSSISYPPATWDTRTLGVVQEPQTVQMNGGEFARQPNLERYIVGGENGIRPTYSEMPTSSVPLLGSRQTIERPMTPRQARVIEPGQVSATMMEGATMMEARYASMLAPQGYTVAAPAAGSQGYFGAPRIASAASLAFENDRPLRSRSVPMTPNSRNWIAGYLPPAPPTAGYVSPVPMSQVASYACPVWPPPPLPPISYELTARLDALEAQKVAALDKMRESRLEKVRAELEVAQAAAYQCKDLEQQLELCNVEWKAKFDVLEAQWRQSESDAAGRIAQAVREAEEKSRLELDRLRIELQGVRTDGERALEECTLQNQEEMSVLKRDLEAARNAEEVARHGSQRMEAGMNQLRFDIENQQDEVNSRKDMLRQLELTNSGLAEQLRSLKVDVDRRSRDLSNQRSTYEAELIVLRDNNEEILRKIKSKSQERDALDRDFQALKSASESRKQECDRLRESLKEIKKEIALLQAEIKSAQAQTDLNEAKGRLSSTMSPRQSLTIERQSVMIDIDMTEDMESAPVRRSSGARRFSGDVRRSSGDMIRQQFSETTSTTMVVDLQE